MNAKQKTNASYTSRASVIGRTVVTGVTKHLPCGPGTGPHLLHRLRNPFLVLEPGKVKAKAPWKILVLLPPHPNHGCTPGPGRSGCALTPANPGPREQSLEAWRACRVYTHPTGGRGRTD